MMFICLPATMRVFATRKDLFFFCYAQKNNNRRMRKSVEHKICDVSSVVSLQTLIAFMGVANTKVRESLLFRLDLIGDATWSHSSFWTANVTRTQLETMPARNNGSWDLGVTFIPKKNFATSISNNECLTRRFLERAELKIIGATVRVT